MDHSMHGMSMGSAGAYKPTNERLSHAYWYGIAAVVGTLTAKRLIRIWESRSRQSNHKRAAQLVSSRPHGPIAEAYASLTASLREISYPQPVYFTARFSKYFTPLPIGQWIVLVLYWIVLLGFLWTNTILGPDSDEYAYKWEKVGFRAAWVSVAQIPFIYLLSCKFNPISLATGITYERFNWLHRWAARTVFLTVIVHWSYFYRGWDIANFVQYELEMMPMVKYGFGAWGVLGWMVLSGFGFFRNQCYELFVAQHICAAATLLWLLYVHVPQYARYYIWLSVGFVAFDWSSRTVLGLLRNTHASSRFLSRTPGYEVRLEALPGDTVRLVINDAGFRWRAGQHVYISIPRLRPLELHPFTIANAPDSNRSTASEVTMIIQARSGFSRTVHKAARKNTSTSRSYRAFLSGPWGNPPNLLHYDTVVLIACSTGASFVVPLLQDIVRKACCARSVTLHWIVRARDHVGWYEQELCRIAEAACNCGFHLRVVVHTTQSRNSDKVATGSSVKHEIEKGEASVVIDLATPSASSSASTASETDEKARLSPREVPNGSTILKFDGRPTIESMIRSPVESALGETAVVVCGGVSITAQARTYIAALSDERAVHKGSGAQGIFLYTETYGW